MITIKLPYKCQDPEFYPVLADLRRLQSSFVRSAYELFHQGKTQKEVQSDKELHSKFSLGSWFRQSGLMLAKGIQEKNKTEKVIFGGKYNLQKRILGKISKEEWKTKRLLPLNVQGESSSRGNRHFVLDIATGSILFKPSRLQHFKLQLPKLKKNYLEKIQLLEAASKLKEQPFQIQLTNSHIFISFEEVKQTKLSNSIENRFIGIDLNPQSIGISVIENQPDQSVKVIHVQEFSVHKLVNEIKKLKVASSDSKFKRANNKLNYETIEISKTITELALQWNAKGIFIEDLNFKGKQIGHALNRNNKNLWKRGSLTSNLQKRCKLNGLTFYKVSPHYSSQIGNLMYPYSDPVNASIEIARRGCQVIFEKQKSKRKFYPDFDLSLLKDQWKEQFKGCQTWKEVFNIIKNSGLKYRVSLESLNISRVFSLKCEKSKVFYHTCS